METYLHLADSGLVLADLSVRLYDGAGEEISTGGLSLTPLPNATSYALEGLPNMPGDLTGLTLTTEYPEGVYSVYRFGLAATQPSGVIIPIREVFADPLTDLAVEVFRDGAEWVSLTVEQLSADGEYLISGWATPSLSAERWSVRWEYQGSVYAVEWIGTARDTTGTILSIVSTQSPIDIGPDAGGRTQYSVNFELTNLLEDPVEEIMSSILSSPPLSIPSAKILLGTAPVDPLITQAGRDNPITDGPFVRVLATGGYGSTIARGEGAGSAHRIDRPTVQLLISSLDSATAASTAIDIWAALNGARHISY